jgi:fructose/tagatose bisphosphate aldolase
MAHTILTKKILPSPKKLLSMLMPHGVSVEGELGVLAGIEDEVSS